MGRGRTFKCRRPHMWRHYLCDIPEMQTLLDIGHGGASAH
jgi:hypothetical protein